MCSHRRNVGCVASMWEVAVFMWADSASMWDVTVAIRAVYLLCGLFQSLCGLLQPLTLVPTDEDEELRPKNGQKTKTEKKLRAQTPVVKQKKRKNRGMPHLTEESRMDEINILCRLEGVHPFE